MITPAQLYNLNSDQVLSLSEQDLNEGYRIVITYQYSLNHLINKSPIIDLLISRIPKEDKIFEVLKELHRKRREQAF